LLVYDHRYFLNNVV